MTPEQQHAFEFLQTTGIFYGDFDGDEPEGAKTLNMNDTWCWGSAWGERVPDDEMPELARLYHAYGYCGVLYWMSERNGQMRSEFHDINRFVDFVRQEELVRKQVPDYNKRAYHKHKYTLGA